MKIRICKHCGKNFDISIHSRGWMANHTRWCDLNPKRKDYIIALNAIEKTLSPETKQKTSEKIKQLHRDGIYDHAHEAQRGKPGHKHTEETKKIMSEKRKLFLKNNPDKHSWKKENRQISEPCEFLKRFLISKNIKFVDEWQPLKDRFFSIDIAFPDIKLGIEVNGNQHYDSEGNLLPYYQDRHDLIVANGWKLLEIHFAAVYNLENMEELLDIKEQPDYSEYFIKKNERKSKNKLKKKSLLPRGQKQRIKADKRWEEYIPLVINSGIDFSKFGWVTKVSELLGITPQKVNKWMKRYLGDFYNTACFKRKTSCK